ncbi:uncharacterized protein CDAR_416071 [Caerostris darwini]|uniref:Uncharacterized protein n=1 Tax=Caerostris darwini TaxID=1538125 RepID=A0AAV4ULW9_9ARAC|nr:uncharacterized protein CDAR_416071 [Caerostris darwini]
MLMESTLSLQVFWLMMSHFIVTFSMLSKFLGFFYIDGVIFNLEKTLSDPFKCVSFFSIIYFGSKVREADEEMRDTAKDVAFALSLSKETEEISKILFRFIESKRPLVLTAWGVFQFSKGFLFTSAGVLITYNLLILQMNTPSGLEV